MSRLVNRRRCATALAAALVLVGCGGGSDSEENSIDASDGSREAPEVEEAVVETSPPTTAPPTTTTTTTTTLPPTTTTTTTTTTTAPPPAGVSGELCEAVGTFYTTAQTTDFVDPQDPFALQVTLTASGLAVDDLIAVAAGDPIASPWVEVRRLLDVVDGLATIDWDISRAGELTNNQEIADALFALADEIDATAPFLIDECGLTQADIDELDAAALRLFEDNVLAESPTSVMEEPVEPAQLTDATGRITATVPGDWDDVAVAPVDGVPSLGAAPNYSVFESSFVEPGVLIVADVAQTPDAWRAQLDGLIAASTQAGCSVDSEVPYDDGVYTGGEAILDCGSPATITHLIAARDADGTLVISVALVRPFNDSNARDLVVESFLVS